MQNLLTCCLKVGGAKLLDIWKLLARLFSCYLAEGNGHVALQGDSFFLCSTQLGGTHVSWKLTEPESGASASWLQKNWKLRV